MNKKLAICVPYRNRENHLKKFIPHMDDFFKDKNIDYEIFVCHQVDDKRFNRGKLKNIAFDVAQKKGYEYFAFHDIDLLPENDNCDYSYPVEGPTHISTDLSYNNYKLLFPENFGGVVLFSKEQFEKVNGYYNEYWNWGAEDDDLYWRCIKNKLVNKEVIDIERLSNFNVLKFNGKSSYLKIPVSLNLQEELKGSYTINMLVFPNRRDDVPKYLFGKEDSEFISIPLVSRNGLNLLNYSNTESYTASFWQENNEGIHPWAKRMPEEWTFVSLVIDDTKKECSVFINGIDLQHENSMKFKMNSKDYYTTPIFIGYRDFPVWGEPTHNWFDGKIASFEVWNKALTIEEIRRLLSGNDVDVCNSNKLIDLDFKSIKEDVIPDKSGNNNFGIIRDCQIEEEKIMQLLLSQMPFRRYGRYLGLPHESEGIENNKYKHKDGSVNEEILENKVKTGVISTDKNGLNNLEYKVKSIQTIYDKHCMINVEC